MNDYSNKKLGLSEINEDSFDFDELEKCLEEELEKQLLDLDVLKENQEKIGNPEALGETLKNVIWEQFINQVGVVAGKDFIKENRDLKLDLRDSAHKQTTTNFEKGKIATHNTKIDNQKRYDDWQSNFTRDANGDIITKPARITRKEEPVLADGARGYIDKGRPAGSASMHMDHTIPAAEIIRDPAVNAHLSKDEQATFANGKKNLNLLDASANESKRDNKMEDWLNHERNGQKPAERFNINEEELRQKDIEARAELEKLKNEGEQRSIETGKQSQKEEAFRIGGKALRSVIMGLLAELVKNIIDKLISWFRSSQKNLTTFIDSLKQAILKFIKNLKQNLITAGNTLMTTITTAIIGPIVGTIKKAWIFLKQGWKSLKEAINYIKDPENRKKPFSILLLEIGKLLVAGLTAGGAILLGEVIEKGLMTIPIFAFPIPLLGSLANLLGIFLGAVTSGIIGAIALNLIDKIVAKKQKSFCIQQQIQKGNEILLTQNKLIILAGENLDQTKIDSSNSITERHKQAEEIIRQSVNSILKEDDNYEERNDKDKNFDRLFNDLNTL